MSLNEVKAKQSHLELNCKSGLMLRIWPPEQDQRRGRCTPAQPGEQK